jgi:hypothetical protein
MKTAKDLWVYAIIGGLVLWWLFGRQVNATVTVPVSEVKATYKAPLLEAPPVADQLDQLTEYLGQ